jgi:spermidine/putrescine transport system substrate-binding protein
MTRYICFILLLLLPLTAIADEKRIVNVYAWTGEIPNEVIQQFESETGIKVNFSEYENNEIMYAKLRATPHAGYDMVIPSSNIADRMRRQNMFEKLDKSQLPNFKYLNPAFLHTAFDPESNYCVPFLWGVTGIFINKAYHTRDSVNTWSDLWKPQFHNKLLVLDDMRDMFSVALITLGYSPNDSDPEHIKAAFIKLTALMDNIKVFSTDTVISIITDEDATLGMAWNGDAFKASQENNRIEFIYPKDGFLIWMDNLAIPKGAPHIKEAHAFINFLMRPEIAKAISLYTAYPTANLAGQKLLPARIRDNETIYPSKQTLKNGQYQLDLSSKTLALYEKYWEELKMSG